MKRILPLVVLFALALPSCGGGERSVDAEGFRDAYQAAASSPAVERDLFAGFQFGMTEEQVDSVIGEIFNSGNIRYFYDVLNCDPDYATIHLREDFNVNTAYYVLTKGDTTLYVNFHPEYLDGKLARLICVAQSAKKDMSSEEITQYLIRVFENANGDRFSSYQFDGVVSFIKDNMLVSFFPQAESLAEGTIQYTNVPDAEALESQNKAKGEAPILIPQ